MQGLLVSLIALVDTAGCRQQQLPQQRYPRLDVWEVGLAGNRVQLLVASLVSVVPVEGSTTSEGQVNYLVSVPLGAGAGERPAVADLSAGDPEFTGRADGRTGVPGVWLGIAADRVVRVSQTREPVRADLKVDVLGPPAGPPRGGVARWRVLRSWRTRSAGWVGGYLVPDPDATELIDVKTLKPVAVPAVAEALRTAADAGKSGRRGAWLTRNLGYLISSDPSAPEDKRLDVTAVNRRTGAVAEFPGMTEWGVLRGVDEVGGSLLRGEAGELRALYARYDMPHDRWYYALVDASRHVRESITVGAKLSPTRGGTQAAAWDPDHHVLLFFDEGPMSGEGGRFVVRIWDYAAQTTRDQSVDLAGAFQVSGGRYVPAP